MQKIDSSIHWHHFHVLARTPSDLQTSISEAVTKRQIHRLNTAKFVHKFNVYSGETNQSTIKKKFTSLKRETIDTGVCNLKQQNISRWERENLQLKKSRKKP